MRMGFWSEVTTWRSTPPAAQFTARDERIHRPMNFTLTLPTALFSDYEGSTAVPRVSRSLAMSVPAVKRGRDLICGTLGTLRLHQLDSKFKRVPSELLDQPESDVARSVTMTRIFEDMLFEKRAWLRITEYVNGYPSKVVRLEPRSVNVRKNGRVYVAADGTTQGQAEEWVPDAQLIRIDSPNDGILECGAQAIRTALALSRTSKRYADDPMMAGYLRPSDGADPGDENDVEAVLDNFEDSRKSRSLPYLGAAMTAETFDWNPEQLQLGKMRDDAILELSRLMGVDPEELGVSTTSRTYANTEQRRLDLVDFTCAAYVVAVEDRLMMPDVTEPGHIVLADYATFLRSDTLTRMQVYEIGLRTGIYNPKRISEIEKIPVFTPPKPTAPPPNPATANPTTGALPVKQNQPGAGAKAVADRTMINFSDNVVDNVVVSFGGSVDAIDFKVSKTKREVAGLAVPWNVTAVSNGIRWKFAKDSLHWGALGRVKLDDNHRSGTEFGVARLLDSNDVGLFARMGVSSVAEGDRALQLAEDGVYDGFSISADFGSEGDGWTADPLDERTRLVHSATLRKIAITATPAFDDARITSVAATREGTPAMTAPTTTAPPVTAVQFDPVAFATLLNEGIAAAVTAGVTAAIEALPAPQAPPVRTTVEAGRGLQSVTEAPVYLMNGHGPSLVRDSWKARTENDIIARDRLAKFAKQTQDVSERAMTLDFAVTTGNASQVVPPGYRPDLYVTQLMQGRPLVGACSRGTLSDATPFNIPAYVSSSNATSTHVEGTNPTGATLVLTTKTVSPGAISGLFELTREIVDSANPAVDAIAMQAMNESYSQQTEAIVYTEINGANGVGGTITAGFVPSGAQVTTSTGLGALLVAAARTALALYPFRRFNAPNRGHLSQEGTSLLASAVGTDGRPLLPSVGATNTAGIGNAVNQGWYIDGLPFVPTWSMSGNTAADADLIVFQSADIWAWESALLMFRFEERNGPARIDLALFGYFATRILRPVGFAAVRHN